VYTVVATATDRAGNRLVGAGVTFTVDNPTKLAFTTTQHSLTAGFVFSVMTVQRQDAFGNPVKVEPGGLGVRIVLAGPHGVSSSMLGLLRDEGPPRSGQYRLCSRDFGGGPEM
jgi:hypothetical protein